MTGTGCAPFADSQWNCADPGCNSRVNAGDGQDGYECAEFAARSIASAGLIPGLSPTAPQSAYGGFNYNGNTYDLLWTSSSGGEGGPLGLEDYLQAAGWVSGGSIQDCSVLLCVGSGGPKTHATLGVGPNLIDAHNMAQYHVPPSFYQINTVWNPPAALTSKLTSGNPTAGGEEQQGQEQQGQEQPGQQEQQQQDH